MTTAAEPKNPELPAQGTTVEPRGSAPADRSAAGRIHAVGGQALSALADLVFPPQCQVCNTQDGISPEGAPICAGCRSRLVTAGRRTCRRCGLELPPVPAALESELGCARCLGQKWKLEQVVALGEYRDELRRAVLRTKTDQHGGLARSLAELLWETQGSLLTAWQPDCVTPIAMHWARRWWRGVNSPELLAEVLSRRLGVPRVDALVRRRYTPQQAALRQRERRRNLVGALALRRGAPVAGRRVLLVDDVLTTGATCHAAASALGRGGASAVAAAVWARARLDVL